MRVVLLVVTTGKQSQLPGLALDGSLTTLLKLSKQGRMTITKSNRYNLHRFVFHDRIGLDCFENLELSINGMLSELELSVDTIGTKSF